MTDWRSKGRRRYRNPSRLCRTPFSKGRMGLQHNPSLPPLILRGGVRYTQGMNYEVRLEQFSGPISKLLELIEKKELEITRISLAAVTGDFIAYVEGLETAGAVYEESSSEESPPRGGDTSLLADFVVVAARLLLIKSKVLLPSLELTPEEETDIADLEHRLKIYREMKLAGEGIKLLWEKGHVATGRKMLASLGDTKFFYPPAGVGETQLHERMAGLLRILESLAPEQKTVANKIITLQEKIEELTARLTSTASVSFKGSFTHEQRNEIVVLFLAVLHMLANRMADVDQEGQFGEIRIRRTE
ncbi:MAG: hypothetical protein COU11_01310 [Candidatus Harrisonbacteria bacterium CG10_big_fil_rev_8_21_14_0_10_49_15]|uniref:Segregation and condensation protein A n=1 Tax=Candidatus Harrisonbacteria bacterium CG10_big_fil_rev_8_21_14_0_10_49_15 TaxID=1974587 RepID=A0A2H0UNF2_9BACT|nr:MAG: hypothetical protein COU11_01310 [Candidatus Harrisonbacteria bacterium CG10_big_fil_rev_8_21_14_0_10_49_15]